MATTLCEIVAIIMRLVDPTTTMCLPRPLPPGILTSRNTFAPLHTVNLIYDGNRD
jgi:hypothetical protein